MENPETGKLLVAEPFMEDPYFKGTVVLLCEHKTEGTFGLILNKPTEMKVNEVVDNFPEMNSLIYYGGPVQPNTLHYIHSRGDLFDDCTEVAEGIFWGGDFERLIMLVDTGQIEAHEIRFFFGYAGWEQDQLDKEITENSWIVSNRTSEHLFKEDPKELWRSVLRNMGDRYRVIANFPENPSLN